MRKMYFVVNLVAGKAMIAEKLGKIIDEFTKADFEVTIHTTQSGDDAARAAEYACANSFDLLVCAGGDGTLSQCLQGIMNSDNRIPIGYIPAGSTNDFAKSLGIPKDTMQAVERIINGKAVPCDVGGFNNEFFSYIVAFGAFTNITYETSQNVKNVFGHTAYVFSGLMQLANIKPRHMRIEYDDNVIEDDFIFGMVTNTASVAGMLSMSQFMLDDGLFEVMLIKKPSNPIQLQQIVKSLMNINEEIDKEYIKFFRTDKIKFTSLCAESVTWTRDGEYGGDYISNTIVNYHRAVSFIVDDDLIKVTGERFRNKEYLSENNMEIEMKVMNEQSNTGEMQ
ncbi:MAG: YegS/Rv2252/BmrU family lipid kinase [Ruminococcus sp.]|nr:YegS/Rv2252/BmrU family lipid kinase [Ruminococcus sp.]